jgi:DNA-binding CsgD family transcriptional regulator
VTASLISREEELASIRALLDAAGAGPRGLVFSGEPGIGKTVLWEAGLEQAKSRGVRILSCRCVETEASFSFSGVADLVAPVHEEVAPVLPVPRRHALDVALLLSEPGEEPVDARAVGLAVLDVLRVLAQRGPVLVAVDDLQWLDPSSARTLQMALRRLQKEPVTFLATLRDAADVRAPLELERVLSEERLARVSLRALSLGALHHLLRERLALELARPDLVKLHETTEGNPFYALELGRELQRTGARLGPGRRAPVPDNLRMLLLRRLNHLAPETRDVLLVIAAAGRPTIELVIAAHADQDQVHEAFESAAREGVIVLDGERVRFTHPLIGSLCYEQAPLWRRRAIHVVLAGMLGDVEGRVRHRALAADGPDAAVAAELEEAAELAEARGAIVAAELLELAADLTPPADAEEGRRRRMRGAWSSIHAGDSERAASMLEKLLVETPTGGERADVFFQLAWARPHPDLAVDAYEKALTEAAGDEQRTARILADRSTFRLEHGDPRGAFAEARAAFAKAEQVADPRLLVRTSARLGYVETFALEITPDLLERARRVEDGFALGHVFTFNDSPRAISGVRMMFRDQLDDARALLEQKEAQLTSDSLRVFALFHLTVLEWIGDRWQRALERGEAARELAEQVGDELSLGRVLAAVALVEAHLGRIEDARAHAEAALAISRSLSDEITAIGARGALGHLELVLGNVQAAARHLAELPGRLVELGWNEPSSSVWPDAIETLTVLGELAQARQYLAQYDERARRASKRTVASAIRCSGLLAAAEGQPHAAFDAFEQALVQLSELPYPFERARVLLAYGSVRRKARQKRAARAALEEARTVFDELGARLWAEKAADELRRIGGRRAGTDQLTDTEERVATLAAEGLANKQIAAALFMSVHTVEWHLTHVYRKLGLHSRAELAHRLSTAAEVAGKP